MEQWLRRAYEKINKMPKEAKEVRNMALNDLYTFAKLVNPNYMYGDVHREIYKWMEDYTLYGKGSSLTANKLIMLPRAHLKSHCVATWCAWVITRHPEVTILYVSATSELAETQLFAIQNVLGSKQYQRYFPEYINPQEGMRERWSQRKISVDHINRSKEGVRDATVSTAGLTTNTTGWHADIIIADDLVVPENAYTEEGRLNVSRKASQFTSIRNAGGFTMACGTRYHPNDIYDTWANQEYEIFDKDDYVVDRRSVWEIKEYVVEEDGEFVWPRTIRDDGKAFGFNMQVLSRIKAEYSDKIQYYSQYYNDPNDPGSARIKRDKFQYYSRKHLKQDDGYWRINDKKLNVYASIDFAFTTNKKSDYTAIIVVGVDEDNYIYILDIDRFKTDKMSEYFKAIARLHSKWGFRKLRAETVAGQKVIARDLKERLREEGLRLSIDEFSPSRKQGSKEERIIAALEHRYDNQQIWHYKGGYVEALEEELIMARPKHDDLKDALAAVMEIIKKPSRSRREEKEYNKIIYHPRFGGLT
jgi:predicted phage terminase large subunit-like protein